MHIRAFRDDDLPTLKAMTAEAFDGVSIDQAIENRFGLIAGHAWQWRKARHLDDDLRRDPQGIFVLEHEELRRAPDGEHYRLARQLRRTLITQDRDYLDDRRFPLHESGGVIVASAPDERALAKLLGRLDRHLFRSSSDAEDGTLPPLLGRKLLADVGWPGPDAR